MACRHRFFNELIPNKKNLEFLFIGTFNPEWNAENDNNADYFYGRETNLFWCIMPHAFGENCLIDKGRSEWIDFCRQPNHIIGLTDIIKEVTNANRANEEHFKFLTKGFKDEELDKKINQDYLFDLEFNTDPIKNTINENKRTLKGVFFTRISKNGISRIWNEWLQIKQYCQVISNEGYRITCNEIPTPSPRGRNSGVRKKISSYRVRINNCRQQ